jgi:hypothetical protein
MEYIATLKDVSFAELNIRLLKDLKGTVVKYHLMVVGERGLGVADC